jgi:hypothetical protein
MQIQVAVTAEDGMARRCTAGLTTMLVKALQPYVASARAAAASGDFASQEFGSQTVH